MTVGPADHDHAAVTLLAGPVPGWLERRILVLRAGEARTLEDSGARRAFLVLEHGALDVADATGHRARLEQGACFVLPASGSLTITALGRGCAVLAAVSRSEHRLDR